MAANFDKPAKTLINRELKKLTERARKTPAARGRLFSISESRMEIKGEQG